MSPEGPRIRQGDPPRALTEVWLKLDVVSVSEVVDEVCVSLVELCVSEDVVCVSLVEV